jgi:glutamyl-Q tRNA(Asp) synthetase
VAAVGSWLDARVQAGQWHLRIDDLDGPRVVPGSIDSILKTLERFGLEWDGDVLYQSVRFQAYMEAVNALVKMQRTFPCACTRKQLAGHEIYPGTCKMAPNVDPRSLRFSVETGTVSWIDGGLGAMAMDLTTEVGDFVLRNAHGIYSYHLANVIDDMHLGITHVVRGADLAPFTAAHLHLQATLGGDVVRYHHLPLVLDERGRKLSKQTHAPSVDDQPTSETLQAAFAHLGMPQVELAPVSRMLVEAQRHWRHRGAH